MLHVAVMAVALVAPIQALSPPTLSPREQAPPAGLEGQYGSAEPVELDRVAHNGNSYQGRNVLVRGMLGDLVFGQYLSLADGPARVMLIPLDPADYRDFQNLMGTDVNVTGIVRVLPAQQKTVPCRGERMPESKCDDPLLPVLPDAQAGWPGVSITIIKLVDRGTGSGRREGPRDLADTGLEAAAVDGKPVKAVGQFRGANLCRDLPEPSRREPRDWVLLTSEGPVWVTGRGPQGRGFQLNPAYRGDIGRWLEVTGRVSASGGVLYLRPGNVALIARPPDAETTPCAP